MRTNAPPKAGRREWIGLAVLALPTILLALDVSVLFLALPQLSGELNASGTQQLWIVDIYGFMIASLLITMGTLGDRIGRRKLLMIGAATFGVASILAAFSTSPGMLIATRALLGIAGATLMPSTLGLIRNMFHDPKQMGVAVAVWMSCFMGGTAIGPLVGGLLLENFWWGSAFLLGVPIMGLLLILGPLFLPEHRDSKAGRLDLVSAAMSLAAILPVIYGLKELAKGGWELVPIMAMITGIIFGILFVRRQRLLAHPLLDLRLFGNRSFSTALGVSLVTGVVMGGSFLFISQYLQMVEGLSPLHAGLWSLPPVAAIIFGSMIAPAIAQRIRPAYAIAAGLVIAASGLSVLTQVGGAGGLSTLIIGFCITSFGIGIPSALGTGLILGSAPPEKAGSASSISETSGELGIALGLATLGTLGTAIYRTQISDAIPSDISATAATIASESIAGATTVAQDLPGQLGAALLIPAHEAFASGLNVAMGVGAALFTGIAILAVIQLRHVRPTGEETAENAGASPVLHTKES
jgi:DHA2 family multidrug resistance protein-like MFS transporter